MKRLRHPIRSVREPFGTAGLIVAMIALIAAVSGTALAAAKLNSTQKKEVEKIAKKFAGKPGMAGALGAPGANGKDGANGTNGKDGAAGTAGKDGTSVTTAAASEAECGKAGGIKLSSASGNTKVCNGTTGFTKTLPSGESETGTWSVSQAVRSVLEGVTVPISFSIPLAAEGGANSALAFTKEEVENGTAATAGCTGSAAHPTAPKGKLCVYTGEETSSGTAILFREVQTTTGGSASYGTSGAILNTGNLEGSAEETAKMSAVGSWAVTAP